jgi:uncharacterized protein (TIGR00299 family) protein
MKTLYLECAMGAAGDMLMAALLELLPDPDAFIDRMNRLGIPGVHVARLEAVKCGITGTRIEVKIRGEEEESLDVPANGHAHAHPHDHEHDYDHDDHDHHHDHEHDDHDHHHDHAHDHDHEHAHAGLEDLHSLIKGLPVSDSVRENAIAVYRLLAEAESHVHGRPVEEIHLHEVGAMDAVADIVGVCLILEALAPDRVLASPIHVGSGQVRCQHGILPVPAPATAYLLRGLPIYGGAIRGELTTPTGAALLRHFVTAFGPMPVMRVESVGYGMGKKDFEAANCVRVFLGENDAAGGPNGEICELSCNVDDMTGEAVGFALESLFALGALDAFTLPIQMKKSRPGQMVFCLCSPERADALAQAMLRHTSTFGVRRSLCPRYMLNRHVETVDTPFGAIRRKTGDGYGVQKFKWEYEDVATAARRAGVPIQDVCRELDRL